MKKIKASEIEKNWEKDLEKRGVLEPQKNKEWEKKFWDNLNDFILKRIEQARKKERQEADKEWLKILEKKKAHYALREKLVIRQVKKDLIEEIKKEIKNGKMWSKKSLLYLLSNLKTQ